MNIEQNRAYRCASQIIHFYIDGFRSMTLGKTLWTVILIKLFIMFAILKVFFFPNFFHEKTTRGNEAAYVSSQVLQRK